MQLTGDAVFLEARTFKRDGQENLTFAVFGFKEDFDRREVSVPTDKIAMLPASQNKPCKVTFQINRRFDGKEDIRLVNCQSA